MSEAGARVRKSLLPSAEMENTIGMKRTKKDGLRGKTATKVKLKKKMNVAEVATYLEAIVSGLRSGEVGFSKKNKSIILAPPDRVGVKVSAEVRKKQKSVLAVELSWDQDHFH